ncbi:hypothetical protein [Ancylobacter mangrovi]|uniref:hypothetical protein n=1 Tax=Ancylobacter mangrovi TaxID=2972472 RepID=UPI0021614711|nr:hypothetical protein [Ancylobacter mangrovi]MCS0501351.1 hypothetical protein [Ancylobacter mangrovi]
MKRIEATARALCAVDLQGVGYSGEELATLVDQYWPVIAAEIYQGQTVEGEWPFSADEIDHLTERYRHVVRTQ